MEKLRIGWGIRAKKYEEKILSMENGRWVQICWEEKKQEAWKDLYGKERESYYNKNAWGLGAIEVINRNQEERKLIKELRTRDRDIQ